MAVVEGATATLELPMMSRMRDLVHLVLKQSLAEDETNFSKFFFFLFIIQNLYICVLSDLVN